MPPALHPRSPKLYRFLNYLAQVPNSSKVYFARCNRTRYHGRPPQEVTPLPHQPEARVFLFSYGTLRQANVQLATFGRLLDGREDSLPGFTLAPMTIADPHVVAVSGAAVHTIARPAAGAAEPIPGLVFSLTAAELEAADRYESGTIRRIRARLVSGAEAFVYVSDD
jgi:hypothetical protein